MFYFNILAFGVGTRQTTSMQAVTPVATDPATQSTNSKELTNKQHQHAVSMLLGH